MHVHFCGMIACKQCAGMIVWLTPWVRFSGRFDASSFIYECIATKNRTGECACDNTIVVVEIENIEVVFKGFEMQIVCMRTTCMWTFHIHIITMTKFSSSHHQPPLRLQCFPINFHHAWIESFCVISHQSFINQWFFIQMFYTCFFDFCRNRFL